MPELMRTEDERDVSVPTERDVTMRSMEDVVARSRRIKEIQQNLMKEHVHYGKIPGTPKPTLYQPGADLLCVAFRIGPKVQQLDDLSSEDEIRYRVTMAGVNQITGDVLGEGVGEASTDEERYKWRRAVCEEEWNEAAEDRRREKWSRGAGGKAYKAKQVRTQIADVANTVLKMSVKRAKVAMVLNVTAASDVFTQDLEDLVDLDARFTPDESTARRASVDTREEPKAAPRTEGPKPPEPPDWVGDPVPAGPPPPPPISSDLPTGHLRRIHQRKDAVMVELDTDFICSTRDAGLVTELRTIEDEQPAPLITLKTRESSDPSKYAPILVSIERVSGA